ncbi:DUF6907 domain-containing protein [Streptomyces asiaticus]|uniref:DUF6907 domain-containing protein n=1 Tax=Streptomyces asiaticus TaxID=114695 RepID=UPI003F67581E
MSINSLNQVSSGKIRAALAGIPQQPTAETVDQAQDAADQPIPFLLTEAAEQLPGKVTVYVRGVPVTIDEPEWCIGHEGGDGQYSNIEDITHLGKDVGIAVPQPDGETLPGLCVYLMQYPFTTPDGNNKPHLVVEDDGTGESAALGSAGGLAFADQIRAYADEVERKARQLAAYEAAEGAR